MNETTFKMSIYAWLNKCLRFSSWWISWGVVITVLQLIVIEFGLIFGVAAAQAQESTMNFSNTITAPAPATENASVKLLQCGRLFDVENRMVLVDRQILVHDDRISAIGRSLTVPNGAEHIDLSDSACLPGLMDMHVHLMFDATLSSFESSAFARSSAYQALISLQQAKVLLDQGFTTIRIPADADISFASIEVRNAVNRGEFAGPRMFVAPHALTPTGGHGDADILSPDFSFRQLSNIVDSPDSARKAVRREIKYGADWIKIIVTGGVMSENDDPTVTAFTTEELKALVEETHRQNKKIAAHAHGDAGIRAAVEAGVDSIEHGTLMSEETSRLMAAMGTYLVPTLYVHDWILQTGRSAGISKRSLAKANAVTESRAASIKFALKHGVKIALGSDPIFPKSQAIREFEAMARHISDNWLVLQSGTINAADLLGIIEESGSLAVGKAADMVALPGDPLKDMAAMREIHFVMKGGQVVRFDQ